MKEQEYVFWLNNVHGVGIKTIEKLLDYFGSAQNVYEADINQLSKVQGINREIVHNIIQNKDKEKNIQAIKNLRKKNIDIVCRDNAQYPTNLHNIYDPPVVLYKKGKIAEKDENAVAIVGSRKPSAYGKWVAHKLTRELAERGITIVSGMAYGIDTIAHKAALEVGGRTIAVLGCGLDICYPKSNYGLMIEIEKHGAILSEYGMGVEPLSPHFPARNRIISGIAKAVLVIEANVKSGSLITANFALDQGRDVLAVPGNINSSLSAGTNQLIKDGAKLVTCVEDVLEELGIYQEKRKRNIQLSESENRIFDVILQNQPIQLDLLMYKTNETMNNISSIVTILQIKGLIDVLPGKILVIR